jgi:hypothetical protein
MPRIVSWIRQRRYGDSLHPRPYGTGYFCGINTNHNNSNILIASHGTVLTLYFSDLKDDFENIFNYWKNLSFGAVGVVKNFEIVEDISNSK